MAARMRIPRIPWLMHLAVLLVVLIWELNGSMAKMRSITNEEILKKYVERKMGWATANDLSWDCKSSHSEAQYCEKGTRGCTTKSAIRCSIRQKPEPPKAVHVCTTEGPMGMEDGRIPDSSLTASSKWGNLHDHGPQRARLNIKGYVGSWIAGDDDAKPWIQVDFQTKVHMTGVITQGRDDADSWVREYLVAFSQDGSTWTNVADAGGAPITFTGNTDRNTEVTNRFPAAVTARYLRIYPTAFHVNRSMRFEVIGCAPTSTQP